MEFKTIEVIGTTYVLYKDFKYLNKNCSLYYCMKGKKSCSIRLEMYGAKKDYVEVSVVLDPRQGTSGLTRTTLRITDEKSKKLIKNCMKVCYNNLDGIKEHYKKYKRQYNANTREEICNLAYIIVVGIAYRFVYADNNTIAIEARILRDINKPTLITVDKYNNLRIYSSHMSEHKRWEVLSLAERNKTVLLRGLNEWSSLKH